MSTVSQEDRYGQRKRGIPAYVFVIVKPPQLDIDDEESLSSLDPDFTEAPGRVIRTPSIKLRTQSLPNNFHKARLSSSESRLLLSKKDGDDDSSMSHTDRPPKAPQRRHSSQSLHSSSSSCPKIMPTPMPYRHSPLSTGTTRRALAA